MVAGGHIGNMEKMTILLPLYGMPL